MTPQSHRPRRPESCTQQEFAMDRHVSAASVGGQAVYERHGHAFPSEEDLLDWLENQRPVQRTDRSTRTTGRAAWATASLPRGRLRLRQRRPGSIAIARRAWLRPY